MAVAMMALGFCLASAPTLAETRALKLYHLHTHEKAKIVYKRNGRYDKAGLKRINHILRDWRRDEPIQMDPRLLDLVWQVYRQSGSDAYIQIVSGYRAPATNSMLRGRSRGVAKESQHLLGKAMDFYIPGVPLKKLRDIGLRMQGGGVGYYPTSGSPFVHMDIGNVRHWPRIGRAELARVFPNGKTLHVPSDGKPLPGYEYALAAYQARKASGSPNIELASAGARKSGGLLAALFGNGGKDEADDMADVTLAAAAPRGGAAGPDDLVQRPPQTVIAALASERIPVPAFAERPAAEATAPDVSTVPLPNWRPEEQSRSVREPARPRESLVASIAPLPDVSATRQSDTGASLKGGRVTANLTPIKPAPAAVPAQSHARYWPHRMEIGLAEIAGARPAPRLAANFIRTAPLEIYVDGFRHDRQRQDQDRFSGSAVNFLPLVRFE